MCLLFLVIAFLLSIAAFGFENLACQVTTNVGNISNAVANLQDTLVLNCSISSTNENVTRYEWKKGGTLINTTLSIFIKNNVTHDDAGLYECSLVQRNQTREGCSVFVYVKARPLPSLSYCEVVHGIMTISCYISSYPSPTVTWYKDGEKLTTVETTFDQTNYFVQHQKQDGQDHRYILMKYNPNRTTTGNYTCMAENKYGERSDSKIFHCTKSKCPRFADEQKDIMVKLHVGETKILLCEVILDNMDDSFLDVFDFVHVNHTDKKGFINTTSKSIIFNYTIVNAQKNNSGEYRCSYHSNQRVCNRLVKYFHVNIPDVQNDQLRNKKNIYIAAAVSVTGGLIGLGLALLFYYFRKKRLKSLILRESLPELHWDVFISYSSANYLWVKELCALLEEPPFNLVVCLHHRDWELGRAIIDNMIESVYCSQKTVIIMSKDYLKSSYCMQELQIAMHSELGELNKERIVLLKIDDVSLNKLPKALRQKSYLDFSDNEQFKHFKTKLLRALPRREITGGDSSSQTNDDTCIDDTCNDDLKLEEVALV